MPTDAATHNRWRFSASVLLPVVLAMVVTGSAVLGFVFWSTTGMDQRAFERQTAMVAQVVTARRDSVAHDLESVAIWEDAASKTGAFDLSWVYLNLGRWMNDFFGHDRVLVLNGSDEPIFAVERGDSGSHDVPATISPPIASIVAQLRALSRSSDGAHQSVTISDYAIVEGRPAIVSGIIVVASNAAIPQARGHEPIVLSTVFLQASVAEELNRHYLFQDGAFSISRASTAEKAVYPILNRSGRFIAFFEWTRDRPGLQMLYQTGPALLAGFAIASVLVYLLLRQLQRFSLALDTGRRHAEHQAAHDRLTGLPNRTSFDARLTAILADNAAGNRLVTLLMLDLDRFKQVNDTLGHQAGDALIISVGERLRAIAGPEILIARLGGDEFALLTVSDGRGPDTAALSNRIIQSIGHPFEIGPFKAHVGVSIGIVSAPAANSDPRELIRKADIALYEAKAAGRNRAAIYEEQMNELLQLQHTVEAELREALRRDDQLSVAFQPLVDQATRKVIGAEALARWHHPKFGQISPSRFIPVAEATGLIEALGDFVLRRACEMGASAPGRTIAVNISPTQLRNPQFASHVFDILRQTGMRPLDLELEITESILLDEELVSKQNLDTFRQAGIHIALDDFGTGYSSLSYLKRYPVDRIKIDRSFVSQLADGHVSVVITQAIVTLAHAMDLEVTAEGVETEAQAAILQRLGCNTLQGFLFSSAVSPERIAHVFADAGNAQARRRRRAA